MTGVCSARPTPHLFWFGPCASTLDMDEVVWISRAKQEETRHKKQTSKILFNSETLSDVKFVVRTSQHGGIDSKRGKIVVPAHKFVLSICSPVFFKMFCGEMAETSDQIDLPDCEYEGVFELLRYIYTDEVCLTGNNVMQVLYAAEKYLIPCLVRECVEFLKKNLDPSNVFCVLRHAQQFKKKDLLFQCWYLIDKKTDEALKSSEFMTIEKSLLEQLVARSSLNVREVELFKAVDRWAEGECERQKLIVDGPVKRRILGELIVKNLRFPAMRQSDFLEVVSASQILTEEETSNIVNYFSSTLTSPVGFLVFERAGSCLRCCRSERANMSSILHNNGLDRPYLIEVTVDKDIMLYGVALFGNKYMYADYSVTLNFSNNDDAIFLAAKTGVFTSLHVKLEADCNCPSYYYGFDVLFDYPVTLKKDVEYCFEVVINGPDSHVEGWVLNDVECAGVSFTFNYPEYDPEDKILTGQIAEVLFKVKE